MLPNNRPDHDRYSQNYSACGQVVTMDARIINMLWIRGTNIRPDWTPVVSKGAIIPKLEMGAEPITRRDPNSTTAHIAGSILNGSIDRDVVAITGMDCTSTLSCIV
jgi:hypothetical protein